ncbi:MAG: hypothetical protein JXR76_26120 [Deltaproteobacteria bacterium]|nr:hypothetical protein [Deltaproteobacteria bacterium]
MNFEKLAIFGILIFGFMALTQLLRTVHQAKKQARRRGSKRPRRQVSAEPVAMEIATALVEEAAKKHPALWDDATRSGVLPKKLEHDLALAREHFNHRVSPRFKGLYYAAIDKVIFKK